MNYKFFGGSGGPAPGKGRRGESQKSAPWAPKTLASPLMFFCDDFFQISNFCYASYDNGNNFEGSLTIK